MTGNSLLRCAMLICHVGIPSCCSPTWCPVRHSILRGRSHPEEVRKFYGLVDEFHRMWDVVTEFDSLSHLATQMLPVSVCCAGPERGYAAQTLSSSQGSRSHCSV
jgi:hypothetical protein